jgi:hypothetical protein
LYIIGFTETDKCTLCKNVKETIKHLMWDCEFSKNFWNDFTNWIKKDLNLYIDLNFKIICFGLLDENFDCLKNMLLLLGKRYIYRCRVEEKPLSFFVFREWIKIFEKSERVIATRNNKLCKHRIKWEILVQEWILYFSTCHQPVKWVLSCFRLVFVLFLFVFCHNCNLGKFDFWSKML